MGWGVESDRVVGSGPRTEATVIASPARREGDYSRAWVMKEVPVRRPAQAPDQSVDQEVS
jgi:hypothetical protein